MIIDALVNEGKYQMLANIMITRPINEIIDRLETKRMTRNSVIR